MTRKELERAIENSESVWVVDKDLKRVIPYNADSVIVNGFNTFSTSLSGYKLKDIYKTKAEAEHYLHHANVARTETLPFLTWKEFKSGKDFNFTGKDNHEYLFSRTYDTIILFIINCNEILFSYDLTEENFYKAYDECVRLFRGEK